MKHGEWLPWLKQQRETGQIDFSDETAKRYMRVASNRSRVTDLAPTSIRAALELLTEDKSEEAQSALGFESFEQYGEVKRGLSLRHLNRLASAAEAQLSLGPIGPSAEIPESHLRPLASLSEDERRQVWEEATAQAEAEQKKLTAKMIQEAVDRLNAEKAELQSAPGAEYQVSPATRAYRHRHLPSDRASDLGKPGSWSAATAPSCYRKPQLERLVRGKLGDTPRMMGVCSLV